MPLWAADPPPPPAPSQASTVGQVVTVPDGSGGFTTKTVTEIIPNNNPSTNPDATAFVRVSDGFTYLVTPVNQSFWNTASPPNQFTVVSSLSGNASISAVGATGTSTLAMRLTNENYNANFGSGNTGGAGETTPSAVGADGVRWVAQGANGSNGSTGALFVPPGSGSPGQTPGDLIQTNTTTVNTSTKFGIEAGSIGGNGGSGGDSYLSFWDGKPGGTGAAGGSVNLTNAVGIDVSTTGNNYHGIFAYSISGTGGGGGGGFLAPDGGTGGGSLRGGNVTVNNLGRLYTNGIGAHGILATSRGGNGGNGGTQVGLFGSSGSGAAASDGGSVNITNGLSGYVETAADYSHGMVANSIGGAGGDSGNSWNAFYSNAGLGSGGGSGGDVSATNLGGILTRGNFSRGIFAQSVGGGGGSGGDAGGLVALGGTGATGGEAGTATVMNSGSITTRGILSDGIFVQSVAGSGGSGGGSGGLVSIGGTGDIGGNGKTVTATNLGTIITSINLTKNATGNFTEKGGRGIVAQSIGGGGGDGGSSGGMVAVGGSGKGGGNGGLVNVTNGGSILTKGNDATGIFAQSVGGGGGNGSSATSVSLFAGVAVGGNGDRGGLGGNVNVMLQGKDANTASLINTQGDRSTGLFAQSVGGGGGNGGGATQVTVGFGPAISIAVGGQGGAGGEGGNVTLSKGAGLSIIETSGNDSAGAFLQSVGGGGGNGGYAISVAAAASPVAGALSVGIGGNGAVGGKGGDVSVGTFNFDRTLASSGFNGSILTSGERSTGFLAQSVGGGGGNGGLAVSASVSGSLFASASVAVGIGGGGAGGGEGGTVYSGFEGNITTEKSNSTGMLVQSVGGGGGNGGGTIAASLSGSAGVAGAISVGIGGSAGLGSVGGQVTAATRSGTVTTQGENSTGIIVQSIGGGGGNGGYSVSAGLAGAGIGAASINVGLGGKAGGGGNGGSVKADLQSDVVTSSVLIPGSVDPASGAIIPAHYGQNSSGIVVQSVGGGGGNGGFNVSAGAAGAGVASGAISVGLGGTGGSGGTGGIVNATSTGSIWTQGANSIGFVAQSIGGGGGNGGFNVSAGLAGSGVAGGAVAVGLGGTAGSGNNAGSVTANTSLGKVTTRGNDSLGILAQSIGGGGGNGGFNVSGVGSAAGVASGAVAVGLGGSGGAGGIGDSVNLAVNNNVSTAGKNSSAVVAQSIGGGGGNGGFNVSGALSGAGVGSGAVSIGLGGSGLGGGNGGIVDATVYGSIDTLLENSVGILAQSVGGGGGNGGFNVSGALSGAGVGSGAVTVGLGGNGGIAGDGGKAGVDLAVTLRTSGAVLTQGSNSTGIVAQSIGGGGGNGGFNVAASLSGAGVGSGAVSVGLGGNGGTGGIGKNVLARLQSAVTTSNLLLAESVDPNTGASIPAHYATDSTGILVQSVGGGGGNGGFNVSGSLSGAGIGSGGIAVGLGGKGGSGGLGGNVDVSSTGQIVTYGDRSSGLVIQSLGGGGGNGGFNVAGSLSGAGVGSGAVSVGLGGVGGTGNNAGQVLALSSGNVWTRGVQSTGILAQSIGGGGGNGGFNVSGGGGGAGVGSGAIAVGLGGSGGAGGIGDSVNLTVNNNVSTAGKSSSAVVAQSIGGGGGNGGFNVSGTLSGGGVGSGAVSIGLGGSGLGGGNGGIVDATVNGSIDTLLENSVGILAQSVGGGGGNGGFNVSGALSGAGVGSGAVTVGLGGNGGIAGDGGKAGVDLAVTLRTSGAVLTQGSNSTGIVAQSIGGGGGNGGFNVAASLSGAGTGSGAVSVGLGGNGGTGGIGKNVLARLQSAVTTSNLLLAESVDPITGAIIPAHYATDSTGILVQSVGGGGGNGGFNVSGSLSGAGIGSGGIAVGLGGKGGSGGLGGNIDASSTGQIVTYGDRSSGLVIQSLGGGGGNGGFNVAGSLSGAGTGSGAVSVGLGGVGGTGNNAGQVLALSSGNVWTHGLQSTGILAQSIGGGGGNGGFNVSGGGSAAGTGSGSIGVGLGGSGGSAGNADLVNLTVNNTVYTENDQSYGILAQSIGGGGGNGGFNVSAVASGAGTGSGTVGVGLGGSGGGGGDAGAVIVSTTGNVETKGAKSGGILAQSVGGGGGNGGFNVSVSGSGAGTGSGAVGVGLGGSGEGGGNASTVNLTVRNIVKTALNNSSAIVAQSVGGGGGSGAFDVTVVGSGAGTGSGAASVSLGGSAGTGGYGSTVISDVIGNIQTVGDNSLGFLSQSVGGGGGNGGFSVSATISGAGTGSAGAAVGIGGSGGGGGHAGAVTSSYKGDIITSGQNSTGIISQSLGGGGGNGGLAVAGVISAAKTGSFGASVGIGGSGGGGGYSDAVNNTVVGNVVTSKSGSGGILAQSLGGGGGNGGITVSGAISLAGTGSAAVSVGLGGSGGDGGYSGKVTNKVTGDVYTSGNDGFGIAAQSLGGGGGNGGLNVSAAISAAKSGSGALGIGIGGSGGGGGDAADVDNAVTGYVQTLGNSATGILAQSLGGGGGNGGLNVTGVITAAKTGSGNLGIGIGGFGGDGGDGKAVLNNITGGTVTMGDNSKGIVAQSLGGGGGDGALNVTGTINATKENGGTLGIGIGGFGGNGGNSGNVTSTVKTTDEHNQIATNGNNSSAVVAQSIGGGGGGGGVNVTGAVNLTGKNGAAMGVGIGGFGGGAGNAGIVALDVDGDVTTRGQLSHGLLAQSIGGGGGNGGTNVTGTLAFTNSSNGSSKAVAASIGVGGFGGGGGSAGAVDVKYNGTISALPGVYYPAVLNPGTGLTTPGYFQLTEGAGSHGLAAQSIGGGGGNGGLNVSAGISYARGEGDAYGLMVGVGGFGGDGGNADKVDVLVTGSESISAYGSGHSAILAQSVGGAGGNGGTNVSGGIVSDSPLIVGVGGFGGDAGIAKNVNVTSTTDLFASAADSKNFASAGILAQSIGGGGGNGGLNVSGGIAISKESSVPSITVGVGGFGGTGSISGDVGVNHTGDILTSGNWIHGIMAQSIAGGGGNGGMNVSGEINWADSENSGGKTDLTVVAGIGGNAGKGANAGNVSVTNNGIVTTTGDNARGVAAQSIGGGGGTGGMNVTGVFAKNSSPISVGVGGSGTGGGHAGSAQVNRGSTSASTGKITTNGIGAFGIESSSIGGGGGDAGMNFIVGMTQVGAKAGDEGFAANFAIGGAGGEAGNGGTSKVNNFSNIETFKGNSHGILAQSIGGGGGNANFNIAATKASSAPGKEKDKNLGFNLAVGGAPGDGGNGDKVDVIHSGDIETHGDNSFGILSQSIGGGGGNVGMDMAFISNSGGQAGITIGRIGGTGGYASDVTLDSTGTVLTHGKGSFGMLAQSIGNGGGNSSSTSVSLTGSETAEDPAESISVSVGLEGGQGGKAGNVTLKAKGFVTTDGEHAHAIFAQSVGGGGGNGGAASTAGLSAPTVGLSLGGKGGTGGTGGIVDVDSSAEVHTALDDSVGILAQSIGGGGGTGGLAKTGGVKSNGNGITVSVGGSGGEGMTAGAVTVKNSGIVITGGEGSHGVLAQSLGGGGGNSGMSINAIMKDAAKEPATRVQISVGGKGGAGAASGEVKVTNTGGIGTTKESSIGILAQSIGGGGGISKNVITNSVVGEGGGDAYTFTIGGEGGTGAAAGDVSVFNLITSDPNSGKIITLGNYSHGIVAMSIGGGGGMGSTTNTSKKSGTASSTASTSTFNFSLGGAGGDGGTGGVVKVTNEGSIKTYGYKAHGILAQSVGGGGGNGGMSMVGDQTLGKKPADAAGNSGSISIGGLGGNGNMSGAVTVTNTGLIEIFGNKSYGIYAQSVGGGGGDGGFSATLSRDILSNPKTDLAKSLMNLGVGGNGGDGADSGNVLVNHTGTITVHGDNAYGIFAQSVSGGGGNVGHSITSPAWMAADLAISALIGGRDGSKGVAGTVTINTTGNINMLGKNSIAQLGQSINGGGGNVDLFLDVSKQGARFDADGTELPDNGGDVDKVKAFISSKIALGTTAVEGAVGSAIDATHVGDLYTSGKNSIASLIQSISGGGGNVTQEVVADSDAIVDLDLALGGSNSTNNSGGDVTLNRTGDVATSGDQSLGVIAQSIGGGGGNLSVNVQKIPVVSARSALPLAAFRSAQAIPVPTPPAVVGNSTLGADNGTASNGGFMNLTNAGNVSNTGARAYGLIFQSIGGGGGKLDLTGLDTLNIAIGGKNGASGNGGNVILSNTGTISTDGALAHGLIIQSIGGGGGAAFTDLDPTDIAITQNTTNSGNGGALAVTQIGDVTVLGDRSIGILLQSLGGGGGVVDDIFANTAGGSGTSGPITLTLNGSARASGKGGVNVFAQSRGSSGQGDISIALSADKFVYFGDDGTGIKFSGGAANHFSNDGTVSGEDGLTGWGVTGEEGNELVDNKGIFYGQVNLGAGTNKFVNHTDAFIFLGSEFLLGAAANQFVNDGILRPGDTGYAQRTDMTGSFTQSASGITYAELDFGSDLLDNVSMTGAAKLAGEMDVRLLNPQLIPSGHFQKDLFHADLGVTDDGMILTTAPSVVINYKILYPSGLEAVIDYNVDFSPNGLLGRNLREVGDYFNRIQNAGSSLSLADTVIKLLYDPTIEDYKKSLSQLAPDFYGEHQSEMLRNTQRFEQLMADEGQYCYTDKDWNIWYNYDSVKTNHEAYSDYKSVNHNTDGYAMGVKRSLRDGWIAGMGFSLEDNTANGYDGSWVSTGDTEQLGALIKRDFGATDISGILTYGWNNTLTKRVGQVTSPFDTQLSRDLETCAAALRVSHEYMFGDSYFRPTMEVGVTRLMAVAATETGAGATSLTLDKYDENHFWIRPSLRFGHIHHLESEYKLHFYADLNAENYLSNDDTYAVSGFTGAPKGVDPMRSPIGLSGGVQGTFGIDLISRKNVSLGIEYSKTVDKNYDLDRWSCKLNIPF